MNKKGLNGASKVVVDAICNPINRKADMLSLLRGPHNEQLKISLKTAVRKKRGHNAVIVNNCEPLSVSSEKSKAQALI